LGILPINLSAKWMLLTLPCTHSSVKNSGREKGTAESPFHHLLTAMEDGCIVCREGRTYRLARPTAALADEGWSLIGAERWAIARLS